MLAETFVPDDIQVHGAEFMGTMNGTTPPMSHTNLHDCYSSKSNCVRVLVQDLLTFKPVMIYLGQHDDV
jgi:hypothetical protein